MQIPHPMSDTPPIEPVATPDPNAPAAPADPNGTGLAPNVAALLATLFPLVGGIAFIVLEKKDKFVRFWAMQSIFLGGLAVAVSILLPVVFTIFRLIPFLGKLLIFVLSFANLLFGLAFAVAYVICAVKAWSKQEWEIPVLGKLARQQLAKMDQSPTPAA